MLLTEFNIDIAKEVWQEEAWLEGRQDEKVEIAKNLLSLNVPMDKIITATGLTREEIEALRDAE